MAESIQTETEQLSRRKFLNRCWAFFGLAASLEFGWLGLSFLNSRKQRNRPLLTEKIITAGTVDNFTAGSVTAIPQGQFYLACLDDGSFLALSRTCTHLGCSVPWNEEQQKFICPCHGSTFSRKGEVLTSPAPRALDTYQVRIENGRIKVDISAARKRQRFDPAQATHV